MTKRMGIGAAKSNFSEVVREIEVRGDRVVIERRGRPVALLLPYDPAIEEARERHWVDALRGIAEDVPAFERTMREIVASRRKQRPRPVPTFE